MTKEIMEMEIEAWSLWQKWGEGGGGPRGPEGSRGRDPGGTHIRSSTRPPRAVSLDALLAPLRSRRAKTSPSLARSPCRSRLAPKSCLCPPLLSDVILADLPAWGREFQVDCSFIVRVMYPIGSVDKVLL